MHTYLKFSVFHDVKVHYVVSNCPYFHPSCTNVLLKARQTVTKAMFVPHCKFSATQSIRVMVPKYTYILILRMQTIQKV